MISVIQRVLEARVTVGGRTVGEIGPGLLALVFGSPATRRTMLMLLLSMATAWLVPRLPAFHALQKDQAI